MKASYIYVAYSTKNECEEPCAAELSISRLEQRLNLGKNTISEALRNDFEGTRTGYRFEKIRA